MKNCRLFIGEDIQTYQKSKAGITLIALVVTVIVLIILAAVTINLLIGTNGLITRAQRGAENYAKAQENEQSLLADLDMYISGGAGYDETKRVNAPGLMTGMIAIKWEGETELKTTKDDTSWYDYDTTKKRWANAITQDGSCWVWIPRYAYKITYTNPSDYSQGGDIEVVFLKGTSNKYDDNGTEKDAVEEGYLVHPAFDTKIENGGWDKPLEGFWVAKFSAGYASRK